MLTSEQSRFVSIIWFKYTLWPLMWLLQKTACWCFVFFYFLLCKVNFQGVCSRRICASVLGCNKQFGVWDGFWAWPHPPRAPGASLITFRCLTFPSCAFPCGPWVINLMVLTSTTSQCNLPPPTPKKRALFCSIWLRGLERNDFKGKCMYRLWFLSPFSQYAPALVE